MMPVDLGAAALLTLVPLSAIFGAALTLAFLRWTDRARLRRTINRMIALVIEFRLFVDEPLLILRAQRELLKENARLLALIARPTALAAVVFFFCFPHLEALYGRAPLPPGKPAIVTAQLSSAARAEQFTLAAPASISIETPAVRALYTNQVSWRIRPTGAFTGQIKLTGSDGALAKHIASGTGVHYISATRPGSWLAFLWNPVERPLSNPAINSISILYPPATILKLNWMIWFFSISTIGALLATALRGRVVTA